MPRNQDKKAKRKQARRHAKFSKQVTSAKAAERLKASAGGIYDMTKDREQSELKPEHGEKFRTKTKFFHTGEVKPESRKSEFKSQTDPNEPELQWRKYDGGTPRDEKGFTKHKKLLDEVEAKDVPSTFRGHDLSPTKKDMESSKDPSRTYKGSSSNYDSRYEGREDLDAYTAEKGITQPDKVVTSKRKGTKGVKSKSRTVSKYFDKIPQADIDAAKDVEADRLSRGKDVETFVRGRKIIEKTSTVLGKKKDKKPSSDKAKDRKHDRDRKARQRRARKGY